MNQKGIANTYALLGGTQGWKNAGYPMDKTEEPPTPPGTGLEPTQHEIELRPQ